jgi:hypothetical protein
MKIIKLAIITAVVTLTYFSDFAPQTSPLPFGVQFVAEAEAIAGVRRRAARRGVAVGYAAGESAAAEKDGAADAAAAETAAPATPPPATPAPTYGALSEGTIVSALPAGCSSMSSGGVEYYHCGDNYFRTAFQGNDLVYVSAKPEES